MTNQTNEELREIEKSIEYFAQGYDVGCPYPSIEDIMRHIQSHTNKAISDVLDNLTDELLHFTAKHDIPMRDEAIDAIQQERNKLKEVSNE